MGDAGAIAFANATGFPSLRELWLGEAAIGNSGGQALAQSGNLSGLTELLLFHNAFDEPVREALRLRFGSAARV
jgi:hypothetical protein